jgi:serine protease AprX
LALALGLLWATGAWAGMIGPKLQGILSKAGPDQKIPVNIALKQQADNAALEKACARMTKEGRWAYVVSELKRLSEVTQRDLLSSLAAQEAIGQVSRVSPLWIVNAVGCDATPAAIQALAARPEVWYAEYDRVGATLNADKGGSSDPPGVNSTEPNVRVVAADSVWYLLGYTGDNVIVGEVDTGIRYTHLDLAGHLWNSSVYPNHGYNFASFQFTRGGNVGPSPYDSLTPLDYYGHGSHCAGIVSGDGAYGNGVGDTVGVAPKARMMAVPVDVYLHTPYPDTAMENETMQGIQFCVSPTRDPSNHAQVITMSLGLIPAWLPLRALWRQCETNVMTAGIVHCVAAGNEGPAARSLRIPGNVPGPWHHPSDGTGGQSGVISIGATDNSDAAASFTSIGPAAWDTVPPYNDYPDPPGLTKPDVAAPGVNIFSTYNTSDQAYTTMSGTSMATPCAAGVVALMLSKNPTLLPWQVDSILQMTVRPLGTQPKNNTFGTGRISAYQAVLHTPYAYSQFMLAAVAADTISPTAAKTDSVTVSSMSSFNSPVTMTLDSIRPAEPTITVAFAPNPVTPPPNGSIKTGMRITTTATPQNNYVLYYHGTGDTVTRRATLNLWVTAPTFVLQSTPRTRTVFLGDSTTYADSVISISGYTNPCTLSASVNPPAPSITVSFLPDNVVIPTGGRTMKVVTTGQTPAGTFIITAQARNGATVRTVDDTLVVRYPVQGPDPYGYYAYDNTDAIFENAPTYSWVELNPSRGGNGTTVGISGDDMTLRKLFGIRARHYGFHGDSASICTNGWLAVGRTTLQVYSNAALPSTSFVPGGIAGIWDDLTISGTGTCWYRVDANQRFIAQWDSVPTLGGSYAGTFEIIVMDTSLTPATANTRDSEIILQWKSVGTISSATVGQQNQAMSVGLTCFNNGTYDPMMAPITGGRATKFTTDPPRLRSGVELLPVSLGLPMRFALGPAVPNPSKGNVGISYDLPVETAVSLKVYNLSGQLVKTLVSGKEKAGYKHLSWDGRSENGTRTASGVYFYRLEAGSFAATKKLVVVR